MLQFLRFDGSKIEESEFAIISGYESLIFFAKRIGYVLFSIYSTIFVAAIDPFVNSSFEIYVFYLGGLITGIILLRLINHIIKYTKYKGGKILLRADNIELFNENGNISIPTEKIKILKVNALGNLIICQQDDTNSFPLILLDENEREKLLSLFDDMAAKRTEIIRKVHDFVDAILVAFILAMHIREYIIQAYFIPTGSMEDTLLVGDHLLVEKITFGPVIPRMIGMDNYIHVNFAGIRDIQRGDIVIFKPPNEIKKDYIKRCIATPGDELHIKNNSVFVNGKKLHEPYTKGITTYDGFRDKKIEGIVPKGMVVVLGDNRENSYDSRGFGYLPIERIKGKAFIRYWNTEQIKNLDFSRYGLIE